MKFDAKLCNILGWTVRFTDGRLVCFKNGVPELEYYTDATVEQITNGMNHYDLLVMGREIL
jgi:hypothetical protein